MDVINQHLGNYIDNELLIIINNHYNKKQVNNTIVPI